MPQAIIFVISGMLTQILVTGKGTYHEKQFPPLNSRRRPKPESREERRVKKYRYLYQVLNFNHRRLS